jgi:hypothetical protein
VFCCSRNGHDNPGATAHESWLIGEVSPNQVDSFAAPAEHAENKTRKEWLIAFNA